MLEIMGSTSMSYVGRDGVKHFTDISSDFKVLYFLLVRMYKRYDELGLDLQISWEVLFHQLGRKYSGDKNSQKIVKILEDSGLLVQKKGNKSNTTIKLVKGYVEAGVQFNNVDVSYYCPENNISNYRF